MKYSVLLMAIFTKSVYAIIMAVIFFFPLSSFRKNFFKLLIGIVLFFFAVLLYVKYNPDDRIALLFNVLSTAVDSDEIDLENILDQTKKEIENKISQIFKS
jgi:amino acid permease